MSAVLSYAKNIITFLYKLAFCAVSCSLAYCMSDAEFNGLSSLTGSRRGLVDELSSGGEDNDCDEEAAEPAADADEVDDSMCQDLH